MNILNEEINRIREVMFLEQSKEKRDLAPYMKQLLDDVLVGTSKMICDVEVINPKDRKSVDDTVYEKYRVNLILIGGPSSRYWPRDQSVAATEEHLMNKAQDFILNYMGEMVDVYNIKVSTCENYEKWKKTNES